MKTELNTDVVEIPKDGPQVLVCCLVKDPDNGEIEGLQHLAPGERILDKDEEVICDLERRATGP